MVYILKKEIFIKDCSGRSQSIYYSISALHLLLLNVYVGFFSMFLHCKSIFENFYLWLQLIILFPR